MSWDGDLERNEDGKIDNSVEAPSYEELVEARKRGPLEQRKLIEAHMAEVERWREEHGWGSDADGR